MVPAEHVGAPILVGPEPVGGAVEHTVNDLDRVLQHVAASATRIQTEADAMAERVRVEVAAFAEQHRELATRVLDTQRARQEAAASDGVFHHTRSPELIGAPADVSAQIETIDIR